MSELRAEAEQWEARYRELYCAVWTCPPEEFPDEFEPDDHVRAVKEAENDATYSFRYQQQQRAAKPLIETWPNGQVPWWKRLPCLERLRAYAANEEPRK